MLPVQGHHSERGLRAGAIAVTLAARVLLHKSLSGSIPNSPHLTGPLPSRWLDLPSHQEGGSHASTLAFSALAETSWIRRRLHVPPVLQESRSFLLHAHPHCPSPALGSFFSTDPFPSACKHAPVSVLPFKIPSKVHRKKSR